ncbi:MAG: GGDEF domain-containing protein [Rhodospirillales bacterium]|nr:GGDEF domain-containing protein [Rhodospirillales bacterium]
MAEIKGVKAYGRLTAYGGSPDGYGAHPQGAPQKEKPKPRSTRLIKDTAKVLGIPAAEYTANVQEAMTLVLDEMDKLRWELEVCQNQQKHVLALADKHAYLPVLNRRAFERELSRAQIQVEQSGQQGWLITVQIPDLARVRLDYGRQIQEAIETEICESMIQELGAASTLGALGSGDFGMILAAGDESNAVSTAEGLAGRISGARFAGSDPDAKFSLPAQWGITSITPKAEPAELINIADKNLRKNT